MRGLLLSWAASAITLAAAAVILTDVTVDDAWHLIVAAAVFGVLNTILKPILKLLTFPFAVITLGIVWFFVSMLMIEITQSIVSGFAVHGFWTLVWATLIVWVVNVILDTAPGPWRDTRR